MRAQKEALRAELKSLRAGWTPERLQAAGEAAAERLIALPELQGPGPVLVYLSVRREVPTGPVIARLRARGAEVVVPRCVDRERMEARRWVEPLVPGVLGIPTSDGPVAEGVRAAICPGLAFDAAGGRLGYGAGFYDRWLAAHPGVVPIGLCLDEALRDAVPVGPTDVRMAWIVTPTRTIRTGAQR